MTPCEAPIPRRVRRRKGSGGLPGQLAWPFYLLMLAPCYEIVRSLASMLRVNFPKAGVPNLPVPPWDGALGLSPTDPFRALALILLASLLLFALRWMTRRWFSVGGDDRILLMHGRAIPVTLISTGGKGHKRISKFKYWLDGEEVEEEVTHSRDLGRVGGSLTLLVSHNGKRKVLYELMDFELLT